MSIVNYKTKIKNLFNITIVRSAMFTHKQYQKNEKLHENSMQLIR